MHNPRRYCRIPLTHWGLNKMAAIFKSIFLSKETFEIFILISMKNCSQGSNTLFPTYAKFHDIKWKFWILALSYHDDVTKWKHFPRSWPIVWGIHRSLVNSLHKGQWCGALVFSLICIWINGWVNNCEAGDLRPYRTHFDVTVMEWHRTAVTWQRVYWHVSIGLGNVLARWALSQYKDHLFRYAIPMLKIRRSWDRLIFNMGIPILVRRHL